MGAGIVGAKKASYEPSFILPSASERVESKHINVLFVCDEWNSSKGGLATFNREFAIKFAKASSEDFAVHCSGPARGVVGYQYTRYFSPKIPIYLKIVKCFILNT